MRDRKLRTQRDWKGVLLRTAKWIDKRRNHDPLEVVTLAWLNSKLIELKGKCFYCECKLLFGEGEARNQTDGLTLERFDRTKGHEPANCTLCCFECNQRSKYIPREIMCSEHWKRVKAGELVWCPGSGHTTLLSRLCPRSAFCTRRVSKNGLTLYCRECMPANLRIQGCRPRISSWQRPGEGTDLISDMRMLCEKLEIMAKKHKRDGDDWVAWVENETISLREYFEDQVGMLLRLKEP